MISLPKESKSHKTKKIENQNIASITSKYLNKKTELTVKKSPIINKTKKDIKQEKNKGIKSKKLSVNEKELPTLANLLLIKEEEKLTNEPNEKKPEINNSISINFPNIAEATRKALLSMTLQTTKPLQENSLNETSLRKEIHIEKKQYKPIIQKIKKESNESTAPQNNWRPKYIQEKKELEKNFEIISNNLDKIANQLELVGLIQNPNGTGAAIIRNKTNNKIEILKIGEEYQELKLLEVKNNQIILGNLNLNKQYIKKIVSTK